MKPLHSKVAMHDEPNTTFYYRGFGGAPSKCRVIRWRSGDRIFIAFSHIKWGSGTSPTNAFEELATSVRLVYCYDVDPDQIEFFDHWPAEHSLSNQVELTRVQLKWDEDGRCYLYPEWRRDLIAPAEFRKLVAETVAQARAYAREHGASEEECI